MNNAMDIIEICQTFQHRQCDLPDDVDVDRPNLLVDPIERAFVHILHTNTDVGIGEEGAVERDDVLGMAVVHDLKLAQNLFPYRRFCIDQNDLAKGSQSDCN